MHFVDDIRYIGIQSHNYWHSYESVWFKNPKRRSNIASLENFQGTLFVNLKITIASWSNYSRIREKISERQFCWHLWAQDITHELVKKTSDGQFVWKENVYGIGYLFLSRDLEWAGLAWHGLGHGPLGQAQSAQLGTARQAAQHTARHEIFGIFSVNIKKLVFYFFHYPKKL